MLDSTTVRFRHSTVLLYQWYSTSTTYARFRIQVMSMPVSSVQPNIAEASFVLLYSDMVGTVQACRGGNTAHANTNTAKDTNTDTNTAKQD